MGIMQREKGKRFERAIARQLQRLFPLASIHRSSQADRAYEGDVAIEGKAPALALRLWLELTDARNPRPLDKLAQAERDASHDARWRIPVVVWHVTGERSTRVTMRLDALLALTTQRMTLGFGGIPVTVDWEQFCDVLRALDEPAREAA